MQSTCSLAVCAADQCAAMWPHNASGRCFDLAAYGLVLSYFKTSPSLTNCFRVLHACPQQCLRSMAEHDQYICPVCSKSYMSQVIFITRQPLLTHNKLLVRVSSQGQLQCHQPSACSFPASVLQIATHTPNQPLPTHYNCLLDRVACIKHWQHGATPYGRLSCWLMNSHSPPHRGTLRAAPDTQLPCCFANTSHTHQLSHAPMRQRHSASMRLQKRRRNQSVVACAHAGKPSAAVGRDG